MQPVVCCMHEAVKCSRPHRSHTLDHAKRKTSCLFFVAYDIHNTLRIGRDHCFLEIYSVSPPLFVSGDSPFVTRESIRRTRS